MVKNLKGGKGSKSLARKNSVVTKTSTHLPLPTHPLELIAVVSKFYGNSFDAYVPTHADPIRCIVRGKFSGRNKRSNFISVGSFVMIAFREFEAPTYKNADLIFVYEHNDIPLLSSLADIRMLVSYANTHCRTAGGEGDGDGDDDELFSFSNTAHAPYTANTQATKQITNKLTKIEETTSDPDTNININTVSYIDNEINIDDI